MFDDSAISPATVVAVLGCIVLAAALCVALVMRSRAGRDLDAAKARLGTLTSELATERKTVAEVSVSRDQLQQSLRDATQRVRELEGQLTDANQQRERLSASVKRLETQITQVYDEHKKAEKDHIARGIELSYWHHFANLVLHDSRSRLGKVQSFLENAAPNTPPEEFQAAADTITFVTDLLELGEARDIAKRVREIRAKPGVREFNALPRLRRFVDEWAKQMGPRFEFTLPSKEGAILFIGSWAHLELLLGNVFENAKKHSLEGTRISFECAVANHQCCFLMTNYSPHPVSEAVRSAKDEIQAGDPTRPRFGLFLMERIAAGYFGFVRIDNLQSDDSPGYRVLTEIKLPTDG